MKRAILHIDGDCFFAGCEIAHRPWLRGKPVVVGSEKGIACAMSYEAKAAGVTRAMPIFQVRKICPDVVVLPNNFALYKMYSSRMVAIVGRYTPHVEHYSIDECFADLTGQDEALHMTYETIGKRIKNELLEELGMTFSVGIAPNKVLGKVASKWVKPNGFTMIEDNEVMKYLSQTQVAKIWGIGRSTTALCMGKNILTAADLANKDELYVSHHFDKPLRELWRELRGEAVFGIHDGPRELQKSFMDTCTFRPPTSDKNFLLTELSAHVEAATHKMRQQGLATCRGSFFLKRQDLRYRRTEIVFDYPTCSPETIFQKIKDTIDDVFVPGTLYRATGVSLYNVLPISEAQDDLFGNRSHDKNLGILENHVDERIRKRYGNESVVLASSMHKNELKRIINPHQKLFILRKIS